ncbi:hypothetical protein, conserved [Eimeria tenella]|uniref:PPM-type phosphatase domain-containing protein n=1 Tax=Eimeria tenella TaxID=5802 RepID=U6KZF6_EIMTE|nr:hypothetical protein, conserved [Eimeria tenella]CDJ42313.1 hypothetical protein, conserved [Eimeria tenella]|eukprot:XP_013233063.1 hypothetical protein, conserved [Eimeria tenella]
MAGAFRFGQRRAAVRVSSSSLFFVLFVYCLVSNFYSSNSFRLNSSSDFSLAAGAAASPGAAAYPPEGVDTPEGAETQDADSPDAVETPELELDANEAKPAVIEYSEGFPEAGESYGQQGGEAIEEELQKTQKFENKDETKINFEEKSAGHVQAVSGTMRGRRPTDEDEITTLEQLNSNTYFMGLFDGHGGSQTAKYLKQNAHKEFAAALEVSADIPLEYDEGKISEVCVAMDKTIIKKNICKRSGSTAAMLFVEKDILQERSFRLHSVFVGDSRIKAIDLSSDRSFYLTEDHKPEREEEKHRIELSGGRVYAVHNVYRVNGILNVSRAFGDSFLKDYSARPPYEQPVVALPGQLEEFISPSFVILIACDGVFETVDADLDNLVRQQLKKTNFDLLKTVKEILQVAYSRGSRDNLSLLLARVNNEVQQETSPFALG